MEFSEVIGQSEAAGRLEALIAHGRVPHAMMLCGPSGCGKMALALALASRLLGDTPLLKHWGHPDLHFTFPTIKLPSMGTEHQPVSDDFIKEWRTLLADGPYFTMQQWMAAMRADNQQAVITGAESDRLSRKLSMKASQGGYKVSIIWQPERMNLTSANKLLKLLEEPPQKTVFILVSDEPERLLETIRSRVQRFEMKRIPTEPMAQALQARRGLEPDMALRIARMADGSWTHALEMLEAESENSQFFELYTTLMRSTYARRLPDVKRWCDGAAQLGRERQKRLLDYFLRMTREYFVFNFHNPQLNYLSQEEEQFARRFSPFINEANVIPMAELLSKARRDIAQNANARVVFFDLALQIAILLNQR